jgi:hypothetical protein
MENHVQEPCQQTTAADVIAYLASLEFDNTQEMEEIERLEILNFD